MGAKIVHICLVGPYSDGFSYQENIMTKYHKRMGYEVSVICSNKMFNNNGKVVVCEKNEYFDDNYVKIIRLEPDKSIFKKIIHYKNFYEKLENEKPNIIFCHCCNFADIDFVRLYAKKYDVKLFIDNHCDETNSATNFVSRIILHKILWRHKVQKIIPYVSKFYGVLPRRCQFLCDMYKVPKNMINLLVMGIDDDYIDDSLIDNAYDDKLEISIGGKIDEWKAKEILTFIYAFKEIVNNNNNYNVHLTIYGSIIDEYRDSILKMTDPGLIDYVGWVDQQTIIKILKNSSYAVFPGRHSVLWEQAVGLGVPIIVKKIDGYNHIDIGGNVVFLSDNTVDYYKKMLLEVLNIDFYREIKKCSLKDEKNKFRYSIISKEAIDA